MEAFGLYLLKSAIWLTGFALVYFLFLRNERFFLLNRFFLLSGILISFLFPFVSVHYIIDLPVVPNFQTGDLTINRIREAESFSIKDLRFLLIGLYISGVIFVALGLIKQSKSVIKVIKKTKITFSDPVKLIRTPEYPSSFSFFSYVFVNPSISDLETKEIVNHELAHIRQWHWFDLVLVELLCMLQWFNPVIWIYIRFIRQNHEFLADEVALQRTSDPAVYKATLLNQIVGAPVVSLANSFNSSINKKRFYMMKNIISSPYRKMKILFILPVFAIVLYSFARPEYRYASADENAISDPSVITTQNREVKGTVVRQGNPLQGAAIVVVGTTTGVITDTKGSFKLANVPSDGMLVISYVGFKSIVIKPDFASPMTIKMVRDTVNLHNIGVPPPPPPPPSPPSPPPPPPPPPPVSGVKLGLNGENPPLVYIDGVETPYSRLESLDPNSIQSINVLKDNSAIAVYGEKGKNGVLLITLKIGSVDLNTRIPNENPDKVVLEGTAPAGSTFKIRSTDGTLDNPLFVIDGVISDKNKLEDISPNDISSVSVLKGVSATKKYGEKAKDGVIEVITKKYDSLLKTEMSDVKVTGYGNEGTFVVTEEMPMFPGGEKALQSYIYSNIKVMPGAEKISGPVYVVFTVDSKGKVREAKVLKKEFPVWEKEAIRVVSSMPDWKPGSQNGKPIDVILQLPIDFNIVTKK